MTTPTAFELLRKQTAALEHLQRELTSEEPDIAKVQLAISLLEEVQAGLRQKASH